MKSERTVLTCLSFLCPLKGYAIKTIKKSKVSRIESLRREIEILRCVDHPCIIKLYDVYEDDRFIHLVTELCKGGELFDRIIQKTESEEGHYSEKDAKVGFSSYTFRAIGVAGGDHVQDNTCDVISFFRSGLRARVTARCTTVTVLMVEERLGQLVFKDAERPHCRSCTEQLLCALLSTSVLYCIVSLKRRARI